ncbi:MAG: hypothetical protein QM660_11000 [Dysgonomonas sp.]
MSNLTYTECISHIKKFKDFYCLKVIAEKINMNPCYFRNVINERYRQKDLPVKYRSAFVRVVYELCGVRQITPEQEKQRRLYESMTRDKYGNFYMESPEPF